MTVESSLLQTPYALKGKRVWIAGHRGMVGSAIVRRLAQEDCEIITVGRDIVDLRNSEAVSRWMDDIRPQAVFVAAATVGGIHANNTYPADFLYDNLMIEANVISAAYNNAVEKLLFLGSSCIYPKMAPQPIKEETLLTGPLEPTNDAYAIAKIAGVKLCQAYRKQHGADFISAMPTNLYGPGDNFDLLNSHVLPALIRKMDDARRHNAPHVVIWGSGKPLREFLHVDDCADALVHLIKHYSGESHVNVGCGEDLTIMELAKQIRGVVGFDGKIELDASKPDGTPRKLLDIGLLRSLGWGPRIGLREGLKRTYEWYIAHGTGS